MSLSLQELQAAFRKNNNPQNSGNNNNYYPFWNMKVGDTAIVRFLPDKDETNPMGFMVEKLTHNLTVAGNTQKIPCLTMYDQECPICNVSQAYYNDNDEINGKKYWRKKQHIAQVLVVQDPLPADVETGETNEGKVRLISLGYQLFGIIKEALESGELDEVPYDFDDGCDFIIKKTQQGDYATYAIGSKFARKTRPLTKAEILEAEEHMVELKTLIPAEPNIDKVEATLNAALTGNSIQVTDQDTQNAMSQTSDSTDNAQSSSTVELDDDVEDEADAILAQIRARKNQT